MFDIIRDSAFGFLLRHISRHRLLQHREDQQTFILSTVDDTCVFSKTNDTSHHFPTSSGYVESRLSDQHSRSVIPSTHVLVDWYGADDPANPRNWSFNKKCFIAMQICLYTFVVYISSAIYTPGIEEVARIFNVSITVSSLGLAIYVVGYGIGPLLFSPLSEVPRIGRNTIYIVTFGLFIVFTIPAALADNLAGFLVIRFLQGFFGSPSLATGGATFGDMFDIFQLPFLMAFWMAAGTAGPSLGPAIAGFSVQAKSWRWSMWEILWMAGPIFLLLCFCLPETSADNILLRRAKRLRRITGSDRYRSQSEFKQQSMKASIAVREALWRPAEIIAVDPAIAFVAVYTSLIYGVSSHLRYGNLLRQS
jgi:DHA1 family multidrug resistance protein-like MFS transporter